MEKARERLSYKTRWVITRYANDRAYRLDKPFKVTEFEGNIMLNEGIGELLLLLTGGSATAYNNANAYIGVGDSNAAENAAHTGLQAAVNKQWKPMESAYPTISAQTVTFRAVFGSGDANFDWEEFTVVNAVSDTGDNLNRKQSSQGTKAAGQTWTVDVDIQFS